MNVVINLIAKVYKNYTYKNTRNKTIEIKANANDIVVKSSYGYVSLFYNLKLYIQNVKLMLS